MPKKKERGSDVATLIIYILLAIVVLKIFRIIPDPPEFDINVVLGILSVAVAISTALANWVSRRFSSFTDKMEKLEKSNQLLSTELKLVEQRLASLESNVDIRERIARLEEKAKKVIK